MAKFIVLQPIDMAAAMDGAFDGRIAFNANHVAWATAYNGSTLVMFRDGKAQLVSEPFDVVLTLLEAEA